MQRSDNDEARRQLSWIQDVIGALALLHNRPAGPEAADFSGFLRDMIPLWRRRCDGRPIEIELNLTSLSVPERHESALALIAHELVVNAISHGFPNGARGAVRIDFGPGDGATGCSAFATTDADMIRRRLTGPGWAYG